MKMVWTATPVSGDEHEHGTSNKDNANANASHDDTNTNTNTNTNTRNQGTNTSNNGNNNGADTNTNNNSADTNTNTNDANTIHTSATGNNKAPSPAAASEHAQGSEKMIQNSLGYIIDSWCPSGTQYMSVGASMVPIHTLDSVELLFNSCSILINSTVIHRYGVAERRRVIHI